MISELIVFCRDMECSGVRSLVHCQLMSFSHRDNNVSHGRPIVRTQEAHPLFGDLRKLEQAHHLETVLGWSNIRIRYLHIH